MSVQSYLSQFQFNGQPLTGQGTLDPSTGGFTTSNAPQVFANLLQELSRPGGPLSTLATSKAFAGATESILANAAAARTEQLNSLASSGVNEAQLQTQLSGIDQQTTAAITGARGAADAARTEAVGAAETNFANVLTQSEDLQKQRKEQLREFEKLFKQQQDQAQFQKILGVAQLALALVPGVGPALSAMIGLGGAAAAANGGGSQETAGQPGGADFFSGFGGVTGQGNTAQQTPGVQSNGMIPKFGPGAPAQQNGLGIGSSTNTMGTWPAMDTSPSFNPLLQFLQQFNGNQFPRFAGA